MQHLKKSETMLWREIFQIMLWTVFCTFILIERYAIAVQARTGAGGSTSLRHPDLQKIGT